MQLALHAEGCAIRMGFLDEQARALKPFLKEVAKEEYAKVNAVKFSATYECFYSLNSQYLWAAHVIPDSLDRTEGKYRYCLRISIGCSCFDALLHSVVRSGEQFTTSAAVRACGGAYAGPSIRLDTRNYAIDSPPNEKDLKKTADQMIQDALGTIDTFMQNVNNLNGGLISFIMQSAEDHPTEAAFAYMYKEEFSKAKFWLEYAKTNRKTWQVSYGPKARMIEDILMDYCTVKERGETWNKELYIYGLGS